jgi:hypothetical protein
MQRLEVSCAVRHIYGSLGTKALRFNHTALSKVTTVKTITIVIIKTENENVNAITNNHNLQKTEIKSKYI